VGGKVAVKTEVKGRIIGNGKPHICVPLVAKGRQELLEEARTVMQSSPDMIEWRADYFADVENADLVMAALGELQALLHEYPLIYTCRNQLEGGQSQMDEKARIALVYRVIRSGSVDMIDIELNTERNVLDDIVSEAHRHGVHVIISYHDFLKTPSVEQMIQILTEEQRAGADIAKVACMPNCMQDVLNLMQATQTYSQDRVSIPVISIAMSEIGLITRIAGTTFGSAVTFAAGAQASAPGQISIEQLRKFQALGF
jgi:3-dehydroquinate dehydratase I